MFRTIYLNPKADKDIVDFLDSFEPRTRSAMLRRVIREEIARIAAGITPETNNEIYKTVLELVKKKDASEPVATKDDSSTEEHGENASGNEPKANKPQKPNFTM